MLKALGAFWNRAFLEERPSISLSLFRLAVAFTVGAHIIPTLLNLGDNYLSTGFRQKNVSFFTIGFLEWIDKSPDTLVIAITALFYISLALFAFGFFSQVSCILLTACCYYFYALNSLHIGTLSYDILLVTLFLMCVTSYHGDFFSLDALRRGDQESFKRPRPFFIQRLLQLQVASTYFYTALSKFCSTGNWFSDNPLYYLYNSPADSVIKHFPFRGFLAARPDLCYGCGVFIICWELVIGFLLFYKRTRTFAILSAIFFQTLLIITMHVPTIFFFLFPPLVLLFIEPEKIVSWIEKKRKKNVDQGQDIVIYDGQCGFCKESVERLKVMDIFSRLKYLDFHLIEDFSFLHPNLTREKCDTAMQLVTKKGKLFGGFDAFRNLSLKLPYLWIVMPLFNFPGAGFIGHAVYKHVAKNRHWFFSRKKSCKI